MTPSVDANYFSTNYLYFDLEYSLSAIKKEKGLKGLKSAQ